MYRYNRQAYTNNIVNNKCQIIENLHKLLQTIKRYHLILFNSPSKQLVYITMFHKLNYDSVHKSEKNHQILSEVEELPSESISKLKKSRQLKDLKKQINRLLESNQSPQLSPIHKRYSRKSSISLEGQSHSRINQKYSDRKSDLDSSNLKDGVLEISLSTHSKLIEFSLKGLSNLQLLNLVKKLDLQQCPQKKLRLA